MHRRRAQRQRGPVGQHLARDEVGQVNRRRAHQDGEEADQVNRQHRPAPGEGFQRRVVDDQVDVAIGGGAGVGVGVEAAHRAHIRRINPKGGGRRQRVVERRLAALLPPGGLDARLLHRQRPVVGDLFYHRIVPLFVGSLKGRDDDAVGRAQDDK